MEAGSIAGCQCEFHITVITRMGESDDYFEKQKAIAFLTNLLKKFENCVKLSSHFRWTTVKFRVVTC